MVFAGAGTAWVYCRTSSTASPHYLGVFDKKLVSRVGLQFDTCSLGLRLSDSRFRIQVSKFRILCSGFRVPILVSGTSCSDFMFLLGAKGQILPYMEPEI